MSQLVDFYMEDGEAPDNAENDQLVNAWEAQQKRLIDHKAVKRIEVAEATKAPTWERVLVIAAPSLTVLLQLATLIWK